MSADSPKAKEAKVKEPKVKPSIDEAKLTPATGWTAYAEQVNGRFAMIGFVALLILQFVTRQDFFTWLGF